MRGLLVVSIALLLPLACGKKKERAPLAPGVTGAPSPLMSGLQELSSAAGTNVGVAPPALVSALEAPMPTTTASAPAPSVSASTSASVVASASASAVPNNLGAVSTKMIGIWGFAAFDLTDEKTKKQWDAIGPTMQKDILAEAPKASMEFTASKLITRLQGVPDKTTTWSIESETADEVVIKTADEGRKKIKFPLQGSADAMRVEELDKVNAPITLFAKRKLLPPAPSASASK
jgi:hypothetical protein